MQPTLLINFINFAQSVPLGITYVQFNLPKNVVLDWISEQGLANQTILKNMKTDENSTQLVPPDGILVTYGYIVSIWFIGTFLGALLTSFIRFLTSKQVMILASGLQILAAGLMFLAIAGWVLPFHSISILILGRFISGLSSGFSNAITPVYFANLYSHQILPLQLYDKTQKDQAISSYLLYNRIGYFIGAVTGLEICLGNSQNLPYLMWVPALPSLIFILAYKFLPEDFKSDSATDSKTQKALRPHPEQVSKLNPKPNSTSSFSSSDTENVNIKVFIAPTTENQNETLRISSQKPINASLQARNQALIYTTILTLCYIFNGIGEINVYSTSIIEDFHLSNQNTQLLCAIFPLVFIFIGVYAVTTVNAYTRTFQFYLTFIGCSLTSGLMIILGYLSEHAWIQNQILKNLLIFIPILLHIVFIVGGLSNIIWNIPNEITHPDHLKSVQTLQISLYYGVSAFSLFIFPILKNWLGSKIFIVFLLVNLLGMVFIKFRGIESQVKNFEEGNEKIEQKSFLQKGLLEGIPNQNLDNKTDQILRPN